MAHEWRRSDRYNRTFSLVFMDVDFFKQYNDTHGHTKGDDLLRSLARILMDSFRKADLIARYGGDEYVALYQAKKSGRDQVCVSTSDLKNEDETQTATPHRPMKNDHVLPGTSAATDHQGPV